MPAPLTAEQQKALNNLGGGYPPSPPLGDYLNGSTTPFDPTNRIIYVSEVNGNDATGDGSASNPVATTQEAQRRLYGPEENPEWDGGDDRVIFVQDDGADHTESSLVIPPRRGTGLLFVRFETELIGSFTQSGALAPIAGRNSRFTLTFTGGVLTPGALNGNAFARGRVAGSNPFSLSPETCPIVTNGASSMTITVGDPSKFVTGQTFIGGAVFDVYELKKRWKAPDTGAPTHQPPIILAYAPVVVEGVIHDDTAAAFGTARPLLASPNSYSAATVVGSLVTMCKADAVFTAALGRGMVEVGGCFGTNSPMVGFGHGDVYNINITMSAGFPAVIYNWNNSLLYGWDIAGSGNQLGFNSCLGNQFLGDTRGLGILLQDSIFTIESLSAESVTVQACIHLFFNSKLAFNDASTVVGTTGNTVPGCLITDGSTVVNRSGSGVPTVAGVGEVTVKATARLWAGGTFLSGAAIYGG